MNSKQYWKIRTEARLVYAEKLSIPAMVQVRKIYQEALNYIEKDISKVLTAYSDKSGVDLSELRRVIKGAERTNFLRSIEQNMKKLGLPVSRVYSKKYLEQITRLDAMKQQIYWELMNIAPQEIGVNKGLYSSILDKSYTNTVNDLRDMGVETNFSRIDTQTVRQMLGERWVGRNFAESVWESTNALAERLPEIIGGGLISGASNEKISWKLRDEFGVRRWQAMRLIRTEANYFYNQAEAKASQDMGLTRYQFYAVLDRRTSEICRTTDGEIFYFKDKLVGTNYPPLHPNCRSTVMPLLEGESRYIRRRPVETVVDIMNRDGFDEAQTKQINRPITGEKLPKINIPSGSTEEMKKRWRESLGKQMKSEKGGVHDYNADLNKLTQTLKGDELVSELNKLMISIPDDYPLKESIKTTARIFGWK